MTNVSIEYVMNQFNQIAPFLFMIESSYLTSYTILSLLFNIIFLSLDENWCFSGSQKCLCVCCCGPDCYKHNDRVIDVSHEVYEVVNIDEFTVSNS